MITDSIKEKIKELFNNTPDNVGVSFGKKITNGKYTDEIGIVFTIDKKLPLDQIPENEVLPSSIEIDGTVYSTDVFEVGKIIPLACSQSIIDNCYNWFNTAPGNRGNIRPLKGGVSITSDKNLGSVGTMGFIAVDTDSQALVGVTNNHVVIGDAFMTSQRSISGLNPVLENEKGDRVYQPGESPIPSQTFKIGEVIRYVPIYTGSANQVDGALLYISSSVDSISESYKQFGLSYTSSLPFASTAEIDNLLSTNPPLCSSGRTTGPKEGSPCGLIMSAINVSTYVQPYKLQGNDKVVLFNDCISFTRIDPDCPHPVYPGDSGSALIANFSGVWKIIGLVFAGGNNIGIACRIDNVALQLGIEEWDGTAKNHVTSIAYKSNPSTSNSSYINCGSKYWQIGLEYGVSNPC